MGLGEWIRDWKLRRECYRELAEAARSQEFEITHLMVTTHRKDSKAREFDNRARRVLEELKRRGIDYTLEFVGKDYNQPSEPGFSKIAWIEDPHYASKLRPFEEAVLELYKKLDPENAKKCEERHMEWIAEPLQRCSSCKGEGATESYSHSGAGTMYTYCSDCLGTGSVETTSTRSPPVWNAMSGRKELKEAVRELRMPFQKGYLYVKIVPSEPANL